MSTWKFAAAPAARLSLLCLLAALVWGCGPSEGAPPGSGSESVGGAGGGAPSEDEGPGKAGACPASAGALRESQLEATPAGGWWGGRQSTLPACPKPSERSALLGELPLEPGETVLLFYGRDDLVQLPLVPEGSYDFVVDWGDGSVDCVTSFDDPGARHVYEEVASPLVVRITGSLSGWSYGDSPLHESRIVDGHRQGILVLQWGRLAFGNTQAQFEEQEVSLCAEDAPDLSETRSLASCFEAAYLAEGDLGKWDTAGVVDMSRMFAGKYGGSYFEYEIACGPPSYALLADISALDTSGVETMSEMFDGAFFEGDISEWDTSRVTDMSGLFKASNFNGDISQWDTSRVTTMSEMFSGMLSYCHESWDLYPVESPFEGDLSSWNTSRVTDMSSMFFASQYNGDLSGWDVSRVQNMSRMFELSHFASDISQWDTSSVRDMRWIFSRSVYGVGWDTDYPPLTLDFSHWDFSQVTSLEGAFDEALSTASYDALLLAWDSASSLQSGVRVGAFAAAYSPGAPAEARARLISEEGWIFSDLGEAQ